MAKRTQIVAIHEGSEGHSIDPLFINHFLKKIDPQWIRPWKNGVVRLVPCYGKSELLAKFPGELKLVESRGGDTTLIVFADVDEKLKNGAQLKELYWERARQEGISREVFEKVVFITPKDRIENWIEFLLSGSTDENLEGPRVDDSKAIQAARLLAEKCASGVGIPDIPPSLTWSCNNWRMLVERMRLR
jgi:hypothetical protein